MLTRLRIRSIKPCGLRFNSTTTATPIKPIQKTSTGLSREELEQNPIVEQAPNRAQIWSNSQQSRLDVVAKHPHRFVQKDLSLQPRPYAAIELIAKEPIRYLSHHEGNIAVCDGNRGNTLQGHPKVYINLDQPKASTCGYCGLRYAKEEHRELIEGGEKSEE